MKQDSETEMLKEFSEKEYKYGFVSDIESETLPPGLNEDTIKFFSKKKGEPQWLTDWRLKAFEMWKKMEEPHWANIEYPNIDYQSISYFSAPKNLDDALDLAGPNKCDILVELIGNEKGLSYQLIKKALNNNINVVTANKALLAHHGNELFQLAEIKNVNILFEAAVAGGIPIINILKNSIFLNQIKNISGILNGTTNFILSEMEKNELSFNEALKIATEKGYAEADPTNDVEGIDSAYKITLLASLCYGLKINHNYYLI